MTRGARRWLAALTTAATLWLCLAAPAHAGPVLAFFAAVTSIGGIVGAVVNAAIAFVVTSAVSSFVTKLLTPKTRGAAAARQADVTRLQLGEQPRAAVLGRALVAGSLVDGWNYGPNNEGEVLVIALADHACDAVEQIVLNDTLHVWGGDGVQGYVPKQRLRLWFGYGRADTPPPAVLTQTNPAWSASSRLVGVTYLVADYTYDPEVWTSGRPQVRAVLRGARLYDPREDSTVAGGDGAQRWADETTWRWGDNAKLLELNFQWGIHTRDWQGQRQLIVGPGRSFEELPPGEQFAALSVCDEPVPLKNGSTERRYRASAVVASDERWIDVIEDFAAAMAGEVIERGGVVTVEPGAPRTPNPAFTDDDLLVGAPLRFVDGIARDRAVNTVVARYVEPALLWQQATAPPRRALADIAADGEIREAALDLPFVTSVTQAQRCAEIYRRRARLPRSATAPLSFRWSPVEAGDWQPWTSGRRFGGATVTFQVVRAASEADGRTTLDLRETGAAVYAWDPAVEELDARAPAYLAPAARPPLRVEGFAATPGVEPGPGGSSVPVIRLTWAPITDPTCRALVAEVRQVGAPAAQTTRFTAPGAGAGLVGVGLAHDQDYEVRLVPDVDAGRDFQPTSWAPVRTDALVLAGVENLQAFPRGDGLALRWTASPQPEVVGYAVRLAPNANAVWGDGAVLHERWPTAELFVALTAPDEVTVLVRPIDRQGRLSAAVARVTAAPSAPGDVTAFDATPNGDLVRFTWSEVDDAASYEIRAGEDWDTARLVERPSGGSTTVQWPIRAEVDGLFWIKARGRAGRFSAAARLSVAKLAQAPDRNVILERSFPAENWDGVRHDLAVVDGLLELTRAAGVSASVGDYFDDVILDRSFRGRAWIDLRAAAVLGAPPVWTDLASVTWAGARRLTWQPPLGDAGEARVEAWIAPRTTALAGSLVDGWRLADGRVGVRGGQPVAAINQAAAPVRSGPGAATGPGRVLRYSVVSGLDWSLTFDFAANGAAPSGDVALASLTGAAGAWLVVWRHAATGQLRATRSDGVTVAVAGPTDWAGDVVQLALGQSEAAGNRRLTLWASSRRQGALGAGFAPVAAVVGYTELTLGAPPAGPPMTWATAGAATWTSPEAAQPWATAAAVLGPAKTAAVGGLGDVELHAGSMVAAAFPAQAATKGPVGFDPFRPFYPGDYSFDRAVVHLRLTAPQPVGQRLSIPEARVNVDVPDALDRGVAPVTAGPTQIAFNRPFYTPPAVTAVQRGGARVGAVRVLGVSATHFVAALYDVDAPDTAVAGEISFAAVGY